LGVVLAGLTCPNEAAADTPATPRVELRHDVAADVFVTSTAAFVAISYQFLLNPVLVPEKCRWCEPPGLDKDVRNALVSDDTSTAEISGGATAFVIGPGVAFGLTGWAASHDGRGDEFWVNNLLITETALTTIALTQTVKPIFGRARPAVYFRDHDWEQFPEAERNVSFFSGHSSLAFSLAVSSGTVASMRGYRLTPVVWAVGLPIAAYTAYSRIAADAHYFTDVVVGSAVGAGLGFAMPYFLHPPLAGSEQEPGEITWLPSLLPLPGGAALGATGTF